MADRLRGGQLLAFRSPSYIVHRFWFSPMTISASRSRSRLFVAFLYAEDRCIASRPLFFSMAKPESNKSDTSSDRMARVRTAWRISGRSMTMSPPKSSANSCRPLPRFPDPGGHLRNGSLQVAVILLQMDERVRGGAARRSRASSAKRAGNASFLISGWASTIRFLPFLLAFVLGLIAARQVRHSTLCRDPARSPAADGDNLGGLRPSNGDPAMISRISHCHGAVRAGLRHDDHDLAPVAMRRFAHAALRARRDFLQHRVAHQVAEGVIEL